MDTSTALVESYSSPHLGCKVLSYSKRIIHQVRTLAIDNDINIYYTDTDSMTIGEDGVEGYWTTRARIDPERLSGNHIFRFTDAQGQFTEQPGEWVPAGRGTGFQLTVELPAGFDLDTGSISRISKGIAYAVSLPKAKRIHENFASDIFAEPGE